MLRKSKTVVNLKTVVVGDTGAGKSCLLATKTTGNFPDEYIPSVYASHALDMGVRGRAVSLAYWDTPGAEDYARLRKLHSYHGTNVVILVFAVDSRGCFELLESYWAEELKEHCPGVPIVLVASKIDLRDLELETVSHEKGKVMAEKIGAAAYMEVSSFRKQGVDELFEEVVKCGYEYHVSVETRKCCTLL